MKINRNDACACGSGRKYKQCCANAEGKSRQWLWITALAIFAVAAIWSVGQSFQDMDEERVVPPGKVWNEEHGHFHDIPGYEGSLPPGPAPPGQVWSAEHGHWHDEETGLAPE
jgi:hypothetical protein